MVARRALNLLVPPGSGLPVGLLNASQAPFHILPPPPPHSISMIVSGSGSTLNGEVSEVVEVTVAADPATGAKPRDHYVRVLFLLDRPP